MLLEEQDYFRQKMLDKYGPGWESIVKYYGETVNPQVGPAGKMTEPGMSFDPTRFRTDNPLSLLSSREDIDAVLRDPNLRTKQDWINELDHFAPNRLKESRPPMEMNTSGVPVDYYGPSGFQNEISPLPHQLEGPETATAPSYYGYEGMKYDPNQELYDQNYYGTPGQMGQMGTPPPGIIPSSVTGRHPPRNQPFSVTGRSAMSGGEMPGLLESGGEIISQTLPPGQSTTEEDWQKQGWDTQSTGEGPKWEKTSEGEDSIFRRNRRLQGYKGIMDLGARIIGKPSKWK
jgi:hypothetical protein